MHILADNALYPNNGPSPSQPKDAEVLQESNPVCGTRAREKVQYFPPKKADRGNPTESRTS